jgi:L-threonylcarbamoyladenylate synthase
MPPAFESPVRRTLLLSTEPDGAPSEALTRAAEILRAGGLVAFPTETVYGLGADATNPRALRSIFVAKDRPFSDPLIVHLPDAADLSSVADDVPPIARALAERFWPGPLTLVLPRSPRLPSLVAAGGPTVGVRVPAHPVAQALLRAAGIPVAAPSANRFTHTSPTSAAHVLADLDGRIDCVLDGGLCAVGVESTVLDVTVEPARVLRPGGISLEALRELLPDVRGPAAALEAGTSPRANSVPGEPVERVPRAPGQMPRHYAPHTRLIAFDGHSPAATAALRAEAMTLLAQGKRVGILVPDEEAAWLADLPVTLAFLGPQADLAAIARRIYAALRELDAAGLDVILTHTLGREGIGLALEDRLRRAAGGTLRKTYPPDPPPVRGKGEERNA